MIERHQVNDKGENGFLGEHIDIRLVDNESLKSQIETRGSTQIYINSDDEDRLPYPARSITLESWRNGEQTQITGEVLFRPTDLEHAPNTWGERFKNLLAERLESYKYTVGELPHDPSALYIALDSSQTIRIALESSAIDCGINVKLESTSAIESATHIALPSTWSNTELSEVALLSHVTTTLGIAIDQLREVYGDIPRHGPKRYIVQQWKPLEIEKYSLLGSPHSSEIDANSQGELGLDSIGGATHAKTRLHEIAAIMRQPEIAAIYGIERSHFLLHGPPGTGKTSLVYAFAHEINANVHAVSSSDLIEKWVGASGSNASEFFKAMKQSSDPLVIFFDEFDALAQKGTSGTNERVDVRKILNKELEDVAKNYPNIIVAAATNSEIDNLEPSLVRSGRLEPISVPLPTEDERFDIFGTIFLKSILSFTKHSELRFDENGHEVLSGFTPYSTDINLHSLAQAADGMTGADFEVILARARKKHFMHFMRTQEMLQVTQEDLLRELREFSR